MNENLRLLPNPLYRLSLLTKVNFLRQCSVANFFYIPLVSIACQ